MTQVMIIFLGFQFNWQTGLALTGLFIIGQIIRFMKLRLMDEELTKMKAEIDKEIEEVMKGKHESK